MLGREEGSFLVFARTKHGVDKLARRLSRAGQKACCMHGDRSQNQRNQALEGFRKGYYRVLVATDVAARGIHVDDVAHVINYDLPQVAEDFIHRVGRTGRAGRRGIAWTFSSRQERGDIRRIESALKTKLVRLEVPADLPKQPKETVEASSYKPEAARSAKVQPIDRAQRFGNKNRGWRGNRTAVGF